MTRIEALAALRAWQRAFEWDLARLHHGRATALELVRRHSHDLFDHIQIVELASLELDRRTEGTPAHELVADVAAAGTALKHVVQRLIASATAPAEPPTDVAIAGEVVAAAIARAAPAITPPIALELASPAARVACSAEELEHLVVGLLVEAAAARTIALLVRERTIEDVAWLELVRTTEVLSPDADELRIVDAIAARAGGEVSRSEVRGGEELVVALPCAPGAS